MTSRMRSGSRVALTVTAAAFVLILAFVIGNANKPTRTCFQAGVYDYNVPVTDPVGIYTLSDGSTYTGTEPPPECSGEARTGRPASP